MPSLIQERNSVLSNGSRVETRARILISGRVQGVFFRKKITDLAKSLGVSGWVKNLSDGRVEVLAEGDKELVDQLIGFCRVGPKGALVRNVIVEWMEHSGEFQDFRIIR